MVPSASAAEPASGGVSPATVDRAQASRSFCRSSISESSEPASGPRPCESCLETGHTGSSDETSPVWISPVATECLRETLSAMQTVGASQLETVRSVVRTERRWDTLFHNCGSRDRGLDDDGLCRSGPDVRRQLPASNRFCREVRHFRLPFPRMWGTRPCTGRSGRSRGNDRTELTARKAAEK